MTSLDALLDWTASLDRDRRGTLIAPTHLPPGVLSPTEHMALLGHLSGNHYPPVHPDFGASALIAAATCAEDPRGDGADDTVLMPNGVTTSCGAIVEDLHLHALVERLTVLAGAGVVA